MTHCDSDVLSPAGGSLHSWRCRGWRGHTPFHLPCSLSYTHTCSAEASCQEWEQDDDKWWSSGLKVACRCDGLTSPGPMCMQSALALQPPRVSSRHLLTSTHTRPSPVHPSLHTHDTLPGPTKTHSACEGKKRSRRTREQGSVIKCWAELNWVELSENKMIFLNKIQMSLLSSEFDLKALHIAKPQIIKPYQ